jgi:hypothetical protein
MDPELPPFKQFKPFKAFKAGAAIASEIFANSGFMEQPSCQFPNEAITAARRFVLSAG